MKRLADSLSIEAEGPSTQQAKQGKRERQKREKNRERHTTARQNAERRPTTNIIKV